ncbi:methyltransferase, partial [Acinetobacter baumannii]
ARACGARDVVGVDLSPRMLAKAAERHCYSELCEEEVVAYLRGCTDQFDLVLCLDVLVYFGELDALFDSLAPRMVPGGDLVIS